MIAAWTDIAASAGLLAFVVLAAIGAGEMVLRWLRPPVMTAVERSVIAATLGLSSFAHAMLLLGVLKLLHPVCVAVMLAAWAWPGARAVAASASHLRSELRVPRSRTMRLVLVMVLLAMAANFLATLAPITSADAIAYRFVAIKRMVDAHALVDLPWSWRTYQPFHVEMLFLLGTLLKCDAFGALFAWLLGVLTVAAMLAIARRHFADGAALVAIALFYLSGLVAWESTSGFVELGLGLFTLLAFASLLRWWQSPHASFLVLAGLFAGMAASTKYHGLVVLALLLAVLVVAGRRHRQPVRRLLLLVMVPAALLVLPWWLRSAILTGNPVFPFFASVFGSRSLDWVLAEIATQYGHGKNLGSLVLAPWNLTLRGAAFDGGQYLGPAFLALLPLTMWRAPRLAWITLAMVAGYGCVWFATSQQVRFLLPVLPWLALLCCRFDGVAMTMGSVTRSVARGCVALALISGLLVTLGYSVQFAPVVLGATTREQFLAAKTPHYRELQWVNAHVARDQRVLLIGVLPYYCERECAWPSMRLTDLTQAALAPFDYVMTSGELPSAITRELEPVREWTSHLPASRTFSDRVTSSPTVLWRNKKALSCVSSSS